MKRLVYIIAAALAVFSCTKEQVQETSGNNTSDTTPSTISLTDIPETLTAVISDGLSKTSYDAEGNFSWLSSDRVRLLVCEDLTSYSRQGIYSYQVKSLSDDGKTAVFTSTSTAGDLTAFTDGTWKNTGIAMYPESVLERFNTPESHSYGTPWFTLARGGVVSGAASDIILTGMAQEDNSNFKFSTAMAVLKVTVKNIPANTAKLKLVTADKSNYPVDGDFALAKGTDGIVTTTFIPTYVSDFNGYQAVDLSSEGEIASRDFYFNIPANTYPAGTLSIRLEDANGGKILLRSINKDLTLSRNDCLSIPELAYSYTVELSNSASTPVINWSVYSRSIRYCVDQNENIDLSNFNSGYRFQRADSETGAYSGSYALLTFANQKPAASGKWYIHYILQSDADGIPSSLDAANVVAYGTIPFYFLTNEDAGTFAKQYTFSREDGTNFWHPGTGSNFATTMTLAASDDATLGNLMISELFGKSGANKKIYGVLSSSDASSITFTYSGEDSDKYFFSANGNYFHVAQSSNGAAGQSVDDIVFAVSNGPVLTCENYLMMKYTGSYPADWKPFIYGLGLIFN